MCIMCIEIMNNNMKLNEVVRARGEFVPPEDHEAELEELIIEKFGYYEWILENINQNLEK